jgi:hypothetical protein
MARTGERMQSPDLVETDACDMILLAESWHVIGIAPAFTATQNRRDSDVLKSGHILSAARLVLRNSALQT